MAEPHRVSVDPGFLSRVGDSMKQFSDAWLRDVAELNAARERIAGLEREIAMAADRADGAIGDLRTARAENLALIQRNAFLEAEIRNVFAGASDAGDHMKSIAARAGDVVQKSPSATDRQSDIEQTSNHRVGLILAANGQFEPSPSSPVRADGTTAPRPSVVAAPPGPTPVQRPRTLDDVRREQLAAADDEEDGTGLPPGKPQFLRTPLPTVSP